MQRLSVFPLSAQQSKGAELRPGGTVHGSARSGGTWPRSPRREPIPRRRTAGRGCSRGCWRPCSSCGWSRSPSTARTSSSTGAVLVLEPRAGLRLLLQAPARRLADRARDLALRTLRALRAPPIAAGAYGDGARRLSARTPSLRRAHRRHCRPRVRDAPRRVALGRHHLDRRAAALLLGVALLALAHMLESRAWWPALLLGLAFGLGLNAKYAMAWFIVCLGVYLWAAPARARSSRMRGSISRWRSDSSCLRRTCSGTPPTGLPRSRIPPTTQNGPDRSSTRCARWNSLARSSACSAPSCSRD